MTPEQQKALARARARQRASAAQSQPQPEAVAADPTQMSFRERQRYAAEQLGGGALGASVTGGNQGVTLGFGDEIAAGLMTPVEVVTGYLTGEDEGKGFGQRISDAYSRGYGQQQEQLRTARENHPVSATVGEVAGALALPGVGAGGGAPTLARTAITSGATGGLYGFGSTDGDLSERLVGGAVGAGTGALLGTAIHGATNALSNRAARASIPGQDDLRALGSAAYQAADDAGVVVAPQGIQRLNAGIRDSLAEFGYHPNLQPRVGVVLNEMDRLAEGNVTLKGLDLLRRQAQSAASSMDRSEKAIGTQIINRIDDFVQNLPAEEIISGNVQQATQALRQGRDYWSRLRKSESLEGAVQSAERRAASSGTGGNSDNAIRQNVRKMLENPRTSRGMTDAERAAAERVIRGTPAQNLTRLIGRFSPETGGLSAMLGVGGSVAAPSVGLPVMAAGMVAKRVADRATPNNVQALAEIIRSGGQNAAQIAQQARIGQGNQALIEALRTYGNVERRLSQTTPAIVEILRGN